MADPFTIHMHNVSKLLSKELHLSRINSNFISLFKTRAKIFDFMFCFDQLQYIHGGSVSEGTKTDTSDIDQMFVFSNVIVCTTERDIANTEGHVFMLDTSASRPGYGRLRLLKKYIEPIAPDQLSSYHMKTIVFWQSEETCLSMWNEENLIHCIIECLKMLAICLEQGVLEHYFHRKRNLLQYKFEMESEKVSVLQTIEDFQRNPLLYVLNCLPESKSRGLLLEAWNRHEGCLSKFMESTKNISYLNDEFEETKFITDVMHRYIILSGLFVNIASDHQPLEEALPQLKALEETHRTDVDSYVWEKALKFFKYRVGMELWKKSLKTAEDPGNNHLVAENLMISACDIDSLSGPLYLATYFLATGQFSKSNKIVQAALLQEGRLGYSGSCSNTVGIELKGDGRALQVSYVPIYPSTEQKIIPAYDVVYASRDLSCVPYPMKFECAVLSDKLLDTFEIHPCVYAYFLLCVGHSLLSNMAAFKGSLHHFKQAVNETGGAASRYRGLSLLGYCHILDDNPEKAVRCFLESLQETYNLQGVVNAAVYHLLILLFTLMEGNKTNNDDVLYSRI
ncbi:hypothetical protein CHS0354_003322 [Potamilus streckersoni]|uniref:Mab-21-like HhH/H2TH-like domain-containing protein n=1 Tax=Potamilus streckersoni TaxID=2493646 RepID=A0AAE0S5M9_9BIVA|nr:hypothetical protein CHS0354_003322 [Potamilus streckersoni]